MNLTPRVLFCLAHSSDPQVFFLTQDLGAPAPLSCALTKIDIAFVLEGTPPFAFSCPSQIPPAPQILGPLSPGTLHRCVWGSFTTPRREAHAHPQLPLCRDPQSRKLSRRKILCERFVGRFRRPGECVCSPPVHRQHTPRYRIVFLAPFHGAFAVGIR